jgi:hypothetical protein
VVGNLLEAGEKIVNSNSRLALQLRRVLEEQHMAESRRVRALLGEIKQCVFSLREAPPDESAFILLEGQPEIQLPMEKSLWEPSEAVTFAAQPLQAGNNPADLLDLAHLYAQVAVDESLLRRRIEHALDLQPLISLARLLDLYPPERGLAEIIAYLAIAAKDPRHQIHDTLKEPVLLGAASGNGEMPPRRLMVPQVLFRRSTYAQ